LNKLVSDNRRKNKNERGITPPKPHTPKGVRGLATR